MNETSQSTRLGCLAVFACFIPALSSNAIFADSPDAETVGGTTSLGTVFTFDFDELEEGNVEDVPMMWERLRMQGFPQFARGSFDREVGHLAPPSFRLVGEGRNVTFAYVGDAIHVRQGKHYRVEGYIRPDRLEHARAFLTAHFSDKQGDIVDGTMVRSALIDKSDDESDWVRVEVALPPPTPNAHFIHIGAWLLQESVWKANRQSPRPIGHVDVHGAAWFDDISVLVSPHVEFVTSQPSNVLPMDGTRMLHVRVMGEEDRNLSGVVTITNSEGQAVVTAPVAWELRDGVMNSTLKLDALPVGAYDAELRMPAEGPSMVNKKLAFVCVAPSASLVKHTAGTFGVLFDPTQDLSMTELLALIKSTGVASVKVKSTPSQSSGVTEEHVRQLVSKLTASGLGVTHWTGTMGSESTVKEIMEDDSPWLAGSEIGWQWLSSHIQQMKESNQPNPSALIEPLVSTTYRRIPRLADYAQRLIAARHAGAHRVFVPAPWIDGNNDSESPQPQEELIVLRTLADLIGHAEPGPNLDLGEGIHGLAFYEGEFAIVALWASMTAETGEDYALELGHASRQIDLWGRVRSLSADEQGRRVVHLSQVPVFVDGVERWLLEFRNAVSWEPPLVEAGLHPVRHQLKVTHRGTFALTGQLTLSTPADWQVKPNTLELRLAPGETMNVPIDILYPPSESAGRKKITADIFFMGGAHQLSIPLSFEIGLRDVEVSGQLSLDQNGLVVRHRVTNNTAHPATFRSSAQIPGRERQYRRIDQLGPKETQSVEYRFGDTAPLTGQTVRLTLRPGADDLRSHTLELRIP